MWTSKKLSSKQVKKLLRIGKKSPISAVLILIFLLGYLVFQEYTATQSSIPAINPSSIPVTPTGSVLSTESGTLVTVTRIIDGDTVEIETGEKVRYIGIDTPELTSKTNTCYATTAAKLNADLVLGKSVHLIKDVSHTDRFGRLLRYVYVDGTFVNSFLVKAGAATAKRYPPDTSFHKQFKLDQEHAMANQIGLWKECYE